jgi:arylsulfatase
VSDRPNILWICSDQQRFDSLGCYGNPFVHTPNLDRLAAEGVRFSHAYCQSPVCTPSRASFLTGRYPRSTRTRQNGQNIPADEVLVTRLLANAGYTGGLAGKLHLAAANPAAAPVTEQRIDDGYAEFYWSHTPLPSKYTTTSAAGAESPWQGDAYTPWLRQKGRRYTRAPFRGSSYVQTSVPAEDHQTTWCAEMAADFIERRAGDGTPWFFSVNPFDPHHPFDPPEEYLAPYLARLDEIPLPNYLPGELESKPPFQQIDHGQAYNTPGQYPYDEMSAADHRLLRAAYWAMCDLLDASVGQMLDALDRTGQRQNTLIIYMSDHGEMLGDHGIYLKGPYFYEPAIRVPLIIAGPGIIAGQVSPALVELVDLAPTLLDAVGQERHPAMQGKSLWPLLTGSAPLAPHREDIYCEYYNAMPWHRGPEAHLTMVRNQRYKLVVAHGLHIGELYDLEADPAETINQWNNPDLAPIKSDLLLRLCDRMAWTVDPLPARIAPW